ncbi:LacI family DNA-binding transcriptional regulator [Nibricoccus sp. IMCC34717]|uniref:LacI family DNA-binding transcriptional regulator n=1 Tax=Nibricoccus sp. IMCC34717 TaxID=3034021 RepID=UPI00384CD5FF
MAAPATLKEIARAAGVHHTTVSMALRGKPGISADTRERIRQLALRMGYAPNPVFSALTRLRLKDHAPAHAPRLAFLVNNLRTPNGELPLPCKLMFDGAAAEAKRLGFSLELLELAETESDPHALTTALVQGEHRGLILAAFVPGHGNPLLDWTRWTAVKIDSRHLEPSLPVVSHDHVVAVNLAFSKLRRTGVKRIGIVVERAFEESIGHLHVGGYLLQQHLDPSRACVPVLSLPYTTTRPVLEALVHRWVEQHEVGCVLSHAQEVASVLEELPARLRPRFVSLAVGHREAPECGVFLHHEVVGQKAAALLVGRLRAGETTLGVDAPITYVEVGWHAGAAKGARK